MKLKYVLEMKMSRQLTDIIERTKFSGWTCKESSEKVKVGVGTKRQKTGDLDAERTLPKSVYSFGAFGD